MPKHLHLLCNFFCGFFWLVLDVYGEALTSGTDAEDSFTESDCGFDTSRWSKHSKFDWLSGYEWFIDGFDNNGQSKKFMFLKNDIQHTEIC